MFVLVVVSSLSPAVILRRGRSAGYSAIVETCVQTGSPEFVFPHLSPAQGAFRRSSWHKLSLLAPHAVLCSMLPGDCLVTLQSLRRIGAPRILDQLVAWVYLAGLVAESIDGAEFFAGDMSNTIKLRERGYTCFPYDINIGGVAHDINSDTGFALALAIVCRVRLRGIVWFGIVCSTWVFMSRSVTGRDVHCPLGRPTAGVEAANKMTSRVMLLHWLAHAKQCFTVIELPSSSLMCLHPRFQELIGHHERKLIAFGVSESSTSANCLVNNFLVLLSAGVRVGRCVPPMTRGPEKRKPERQKS